MLLLCIYIKSLETDESPTESSCLVSVRERISHCITTHIYTVLQFDPVGLAQWAPAEHLRKAELSHGRSAMLATVGWVWPKLVGTFNSEDVTTTDPMDAIMQADPQWWAQFIIFCGTIEAIKYRGEIEGKSYTGEGPAAIDWANQWEKLDDKKKMDMRLKELKNGRLAMIGIAGFVSNYYIPGSVPGMPEGLF